MSETYQDPGEWTDMEKEYKADDEGIEAEKDCECDISTMRSAFPSIRPVQKSFYAAPMHHFSIATSLGETAHIYIPRDITLADWQELERILNVLKPKQKRRRKRR